jgi:hypothetical protein
MKVLVYVDTHNVGSDAVRRIDELFFDPLFETSNVRIDPPEGLKVPDGMTFDDAFEQYRINYFLNDAVQSHKSESDDPLYVIYVKDSSISSASSDVVRDVVLTALDRPEWDLLYMSKWLDKCNLHTNRVNVEGRNISLVKTVNPKGIQAIMFSPRAIEILLGKRPLPTQAMLTFNSSVSDVLNQAVSENWLTALATEPNLFHVDPALIRDPTELSKTHNCEVPGALTVHEVKKKIEGHNHNMTNSVNGWAIIWLVIIAVLFLLIIWLAFRRRST